MTWRARARAVVITASFGAVSGALAPASGQHEHHGVRALDTLTVRALRDAVQLASGVTVVDVRASASAGGSIADLLRTVPGVELDADGRVNMRGSAGVLVLMNGRRSTLTGEALVAFLRQMPATALDRIEAGSVASAQWDANSAAGVVNLVFHEERSRRGMRSMAGSVATGNQYMGSIAGGGVLGDILSWDASYALSSIRPPTSSTTKRWSLVPGDLPLRTDQDTRARETHRLHSIMASATVTPTAVTSLTVRGMYSRMEGANRSRSVFVYTNAAGDNGTSATGSVLEHWIPSGELSAVAGFERGGLRLGAEAGTGFVNEDFNGDYVDAGGDYSYMTKRMTSQQRRHTLRNDIGIRASGVNVAIGHESQFRRTIAAHDATHFGATSSQEFRYDTDVHAAWISAQHSTGAIRVETGLRVEAERRRVELATASAENDVHFFPSISGEYRSADRGTAYRFAYARRIHRPDAELLNPFPMSGDDVNEIIGNPSLVPEIADQVEIGAAYDVARAAFQLTPFYRRTRHPIRQLKTATASGGSTTTLRNLGRARTVGAEGSVRARAADRAVVTLALSLAHMETAGEQLGSSGVHGTARFTVDLRLSETTTAQLYAYRRSAESIEQGEIMPSFTSDFALTQRFAGGRGRVTLRLNDPLRSDRLGFRVADTAFTQESRRRTTRPLLSLFASYAVGSTPREDAPVRTQGPVRIF